jgi:hypothetical protein
MEGRVRLPDFFMLREDEAMPLAPRQEKRRLIITILFGLMSQIK